MAIHRARLDCFVQTDPRNQIAHGPPFGSPSGLALSMPVCMQTFPLAPGLTALPRAHHAPASSARPSVHLSVTRRARNEHGRVQCHRPSGLGSPWSAIRLAIGSRADGWLNDTGLTRPEGLFAVWKAHGPLFAGGSPPALCMPVCMQTFLLAPSTFASAYLGASIPAWWPLLGGSWDQEGLTVHHGAALSACLWPHCSHSCPTMYE